MHVKIHVHVEDKEGIICIDLVNIISKHHLIFC